MTDLDKQLFEDLFEKKQYKTLRQKLLDLEPVDISQLLNEAPRDNAMIAFRLLPKSLAVDVFDHMDRNMQNWLLESFSDQAAKTFLEAMPPDDRVELLDEVPAMVAKKLLQILSPEQRQVTMELLGYKEKTAGRAMTPYFIDLRQDMSATQAIQRIRDLSLNSETVDESYAMDENVT